MLRALLVFVACCFLMSAEEARAQPTSTSGPRVKAPVTFVLDTVLFRLPRAQVTDTALVTMGERPTTARYYAKWRGAGTGRPVNVQCLQTPGGRAAIIDSFRLLRTDSTVVAPVRRYVMNCPLASTGF
jgi:hypothetical protein